MLITSLASGPSSKPRPDHFVKFDEYGHLSTKDEHARLDNFGFQLRAQPDSKGHVLVREGPAGSIKNLKKHACRSILYLIKGQPKIEAARIVAVAGVVPSHLGPEFETELWILPSEIPSDALAVTLDNTKQIPIIITGAEALRQCRK